MIGWNNHGNYEQGHRQNTVMATAGTLYCTPRSLQKGGLRKLDNGDRLDCKSKQQLILVARLNNGNVIIWVPGTCDVALDK